MIEIGDLLVTRGTDWASRLIRLGAAILDEPNIDNHVAVVHHKEGEVWWVIEGRPGGVGWADARNYLKSAYTTNNILQPKTPEQRQKVAEAAKAMIGTPYDWKAIVEDGLKSVDITPLWTENWDGQGPPGHVVCSSLAAYVYKQAGLAVPVLHEPRLTTPADWEQFILANRYAGN